MTESAEIGMIGVLLILLCIHIGIILKWIPYTIVWGGRLKSDKEMYRNETVSVLMILFFIWVITERTLSLTGFIPDKVSDVILWVMTVLMAFSTIGSLTSKNKTERIIFTPIAISLFALCLIVLLG